MTDNELLSALSKMIEPLNGEIKGIHKRLDKVDERLDKMDERLDKMDERLDKMDERLDRIDERLDKVEDQVREVKEQVKEVGEQTIRTQLLLENEISQKIDVIGNGHDFLKQRLDNALSIEKYREAMELRIIDHEIRLKELERSKKKEVS